MKCQWETKLVPVLEQLGQTMGPNWARVQNTEYSRGQGIQNTEVWGQNTEHRGLGPRLWGDNTVYICILYRNAEYAEYCSLGIEYRIQDTGA